MTLFVGILGCSENVWSVRIPDLGIFAHGAGAESVLSQIVHLGNSECRKRITHRQEIPKPRAAAEIAADPSAGFDPDAGNDIVTIAIDVDWRAKASPTK